MAIAYVSSGTLLAQNAASHDVPYPATVNAGDLLVLHASSNGSAVSAVSGWVEVYRETVISNPKGGLWYKVADGTEGGTTQNITTATATATSAQIHRYTGVDTTTPTDGTATNVSSATTGTSIVLPSITTTSANTMLVYASSVNSSTTQVSSTTGTERSDYGASGGGKGGGLYDEAVAASGATGTRTITIAAARSYWGAMLALKPASSVTNTNAVVATGTAAAVAPTVTGEATVTAVAATGTAAALVPAIGTEGAVATPAATVAASAPAPVVTDGSAKATITLQGTPSVSELGTSATTIDVPYPSGIVTGELLTAHLAYNDDLPPTTVPSGWTEAITWDSGSNNSGGLYYKIATGSETGNVTFTAASTFASATGIIIRWSGVDGTTPLDVTTVKANHAGTALTITQPSQTIATPGAVVVSSVTIASVSSRDILDETGWTRVATSTGTGRRIVVFSRTYASTGATGTTEWDQSGATNLEMAVAAMALRPGPAVTGSVTGIKATGSAAAIAPTVSGAVGVTSPVGTVSSLAPVPAISIAPTVAGVPATGTTAAIAPAVSAGAFVTVTSPVATATTLAPIPVVTGQIAANVTSPVATATTLAPAPAVAWGASVTSPVSSVTAASPTPVVAIVAGVVAVPAVGSAAAPAPTVTGAASVTAVAATVTSVAPVPQVGIGATVISPTATVSGSAKVPVATAGSTVSIPVVGVSVSALAPQVVAGVQALRATATVTARPPVVGASSVVAVPVATATAAAQTAVVVGGVGAVKATVSVSARPASVLGGGGITAPKATVAALALPPVVNVIGTINAPKATVAAVARTATVQGLRSVTLVLTRAQVSVDSGDNAIIWVQNPILPGYVGAKQFTRTGTLTMSGKPGPANTLALGTALSKQTSATVQAGAPLQINHTTTFNGGNAAGVTSSGGLSRIQPHTVALSQAALTITNALSLQTMDLSRNLFGVPQITGSPITLTGMGNLGLSGTASIPGQLVYRRCETHTAFIYDRGGRRQIGALSPIAHIKWERKRDDISSATVTIQSPDRACANMLELIESARMELVIFRGNIRVWEGPITRVAYRGDRVEIFAQDVMWYVHRTIMMNEYDNRYPNTAPVLERIERVMRAEVARLEAADPAINVIPHMRFIRATDGAVDARTAARTLPYEMTVFEHVDTYAARGGIDYTVVGRMVLFFDVHQIIGQTAMVTRDDFLGDPIITQYGAELGTYVAMTDGKGNFGDAGGDDPYYGRLEILHQAYDETAGPAETNQPPSVAEMTSQARRAYTAGKIPPLVVRVPDGTRLNPNGVLDITMLVPGVHIPLNAALPGRNVTQMQKLDSMTVEETPENGEVIQVTLSPATIEQFVED